MISKNNQIERSRKAKMQNKKNRFSIRKLTIGAASVLLGFSFVAMNEQIAKADTVDANNQETSTKTEEKSTSNKTVQSNTTNNANQTVQSNTTNNANQTESDLTTYKGLHSFLRDDSQTTDPQDSNTASSSEEAVTGKHIDHSTDSGALADAATDLQTEISKGHDFVATDSYKNTTEDRQKGVTDAIADGQTTLDKYSKYLSTNNDAFKVNVMDLTDAKITIGSMITAATNTVSTQDLNSYGGWGLQFADGTLTIKAVSSSNSTNDQSEPFYKFLNDQGLDASNVTKIIIKDDNGGITLNQSNNNVENNSGVFGNLTGLTSIDGLKNIKLDTSSTQGLHGLFANDSSLTSLDFHGFTSAARLINDMSYMFYNTTALKTLDLTDLRIIGSSTLNVEKMFENAGIEDGFKLILDAGSIPENADIGEGRNYVRAFNAGKIYVGTHDDSTTTGYDQIAALQGAIAGGVAADTYVMSNKQAASLRYSISPNKAWVVNLHPGQRSVNVTDLGNNMLSGDTLKNLEQTSDKIFTDKKIITGLSWMTFKMTTSPTTNQGYKDNDVGTTAGITNDATGTIPSTSVPNPEDTIKINFADGTYTYIRVKFVVAAAELNSDANPISSQKDTTISPTEKIDPNNQNNSDLDKAILNYVNIPNEWKKMDEGKSEADPKYIKYITISKADGNALDLDWSRLAGSDDVKSESAKITIHFTDDFDANGTMQSPGQEITGNVQIASMAKSSGLSFTPQQTYPTTNASGILATAQVELSKDPNAISMIWDPSAPVPTFTTLGLHSPQVQVTFKDGSTGLKTVPVTVVPNPGESNADQIVKEIVQNKQVDLEIPQYTDLTNDHTLAASVAAGVNLPKGTTFAWDQSKLPDTYTKGTKATAFVIVTSPDGSVANVPVNVTIGDPITHDIKLKHNAYLYNKHGERANGISLKTGSVITVFGTRVIDGRKFYLTKDAAYYIAVGNYNPVTRKLDKTALTYNGKGKKVVSAKKFKGEQIQTYGIPVVIKGKEYYAIGHKCYMRKVNFPPTPEWVVPRLTKQDLADGVVQRQLKKNAFVYTNKLNRANEVVLSAGSIIKTRGTKTISNQQYYDLGNNMYVDVRNVKRG
ncbi:SLAP domain-containing protein [Lactobacillus sp. ESL0791]|uniref:SLAP domain-containing protein n=1 Tax=Lactobacillus sp. ESL0791 TaxID=2983234 RepID=UPI0023FA05FD|nr:SLAP domain-containing protein [Lactobacillus sp. ESL0791]MDF7639200.1 SLAP domain-containing protein [Lactobacillus sp. ESL0791]